MIPPSAPLRILLVDDHAVVRVGLRKMIDDEPDLKVVGEAGSCAEALSIAADTDPAVIVLDLRLPDGSGFQIITPLKRVARHARVLMLTSFADDSLLLAAIKAGADGYLLKDVAGADLLGSIRQVATGAAVTPPPNGSGPQPDASPANPPLAALTGQERRVFELVGRGHSNREVAEATGLTEKTVRNYLSHIYDKLGLVRRSQIVALFMSNGHWKG